MGRLVAVGRGTHVGTMVEIEVEANMAQVDLLHSLLQRAGCLCPLHVRAVPQALLRRRVKCLQARCPLLLTAALSKACTGLAWRSVATGSPGTGAATTAAAHHELALQASQGRRVEAHAHQVHVARLHEGGFLLGRQLHLPLHEEQSLLSSERKDPGLHTFLRVSKDPGHMPIRPCGHTRMLL